MMKGPEGRHSGGGSGQPGSHAGRDGTGWDSHVATLGRVKVAGSALLRLSLATLPLLLGCHSERAPSQAFAAACRSATPVSEAAFRKVDCSSPRSPPRTASASATPEAKRLWSLIDAIEDSFPLDPSRLAPLLGVEFAAVKDARGECYLLSKSIAANRFAIDLIQVTLSRRGTSSERLALYIGTTDVTISAMEAALEGGHAIPPPPPYPGMEHLGRAYFAERSWGVLSFGSCSDGSLATVNFAVGAEMLRGV
jgi:hypothetical protein